jgi:putative spermidine/putrescine transport system permease protein
MARKQRHILMKALIYTSYFLVLFPILILLIWSFTGLWPWPYLLPETFSARALGEFFGGYSGALNVLGTSIVMSAVVALLAVAVSLSAARAIVLHDFVGRKLLEFMVLMPVIVPATAFAMGIDVLFMRVGLSDTVLGVILVHIILCLPYTVRIMTEVTEATGNKLETQARVLGASPIRVLTNITLPIAIPGIISSACMAFIISFSQYFVTLLIGGGNVVTYSVFMFPYIANSDRTIASAHGVLFILSTLIVFAILNRLVKRYYDIDNIFFFS